MVKSKKNLSLSEGIVQKGIERSEELGFDFSGYITYLINLDLQGFIGNNFNDRVIFKKEKKKVNEDEIKATIVTKELAGDIEDILNCNI